MSTAANPWRRGGFHQGVVSCERDGAPKPSLGTSVERKKKAIRQKRARSSSSDCSMQGWKENKSLGYWGHATEMEKTPREGREGSATYKKKNPPEGRNTQPVRKKSRRRRTAPRVQNNEGGDARNEERKAYTQRKGAVKRCRWYVLRAAESRRTTGKKR